MKHILLLFTILCLSCLKSMANGRAEVEAPTIDADRAEVAYMYNYTQQYGVWQLVLYSGNTALCTFEIDAASTKRIAKTYSFAEGNLLSGKYNPDASTAVNFTDGSLTLAYAGKGTPYPSYSIIAELKDAAAETYTIATDVEMMAYDYMMYQYYTLGVIGLDQCLIQLQDAPEEESGIVYEVPCVGGNWADYTTDMGVIKVTAEDDEGHFVQLLFDAANVATGTYALSDTYAAYCYLANLNTQQYDAYFMSGEAQIEVFGKALTVAARILAKNGDVYLITIPVAVPEGEDYHDYLDGIMSVTSPCSNSGKRLVSGRVVIKNEGKTYDDTGIIVK